eukprot:CAMPEP_0119269712 /NCGR_PEP_ID=MMETSP1329-20130426/7007_1 /TAXON_ID=114041 /ORGANISM="Genus nov. species nov., Strain RCC1024" /LENGTH=286 /DNA_ID=CAMNT_0007269713 /DNA_START=48 /DNA_END=904 /DNA_ORIENTATION=-
MSSDHLVVAGSYEGGLHGWTAAGDAQASELALRFSFGAHGGCCRCVATNGDAKRGALLSGGDDEVVRVYSLRTFRQVGELTRHTGTITALAFCGKKHALSASADGTIIVWRVNDWACVHVLGGHKASVLSLAPHPSSKLLLSTGADRTLRLWDLVEGRAAFITRTKGASSKVMWGPKAETYALVLGARVEVRDLSDGSVVSDIDAGAAVLDAIYLEGANFVAIADGTGAVCVYSADDGERVWRRGRRGPSTPGRVKALWCAGAVLAAEDDAVADADGLAAWGASRA